MASGTPGCYSQFKDRQRRRSQPSVRSTTLRRGGTAKRFGPCGRLATTSARLGRPPAALARPVIANERAAARPLNRQLHGNQAAWSANSTAPVDRHINMGNPCKPYLAQRGARRLKPTLTASTYRWLPTYL